MKSCTPGPQSNLLSDFNIPIGSEILLTSELNSSHMMSDIHHVDSKPDVSGKAPSVAKKPSEISKDQWTGESKFQNVVSKKVYLLVSNRRSIEDHIQDGFRWIDNL